MNKAEIFYRDIGDYLSREEKLKIISEGRSILNPELKMSKLKTNEHGDWINKRNSRFDEFIPIEPEDKFNNKAQSFFTAYAIGVATNRDAWVYNFSGKQLEKNMKKMIGFYNAQRKLIGSEYTKNPKINIDDYLDANPRKISWTVNLKKDVANNITHKYNENVFKTSLYRPFTKTNLFFDNGFIERPGIWVQLFPEQKSKNLVICLSGIGSIKSFSILISDMVPCLDLVEKSQCFPLYWYEKKVLAQGGLFEQIEDEYIRHDAISDFILEQGQTRYGPKVIKEDIFYYVYGILHSPNYRKTFANDLKKMLPRLPLVEKPAEFWAFSEAGRKLAEIHLNYEEQEPPKDVLINDKMGTGDWGLGAGELEMGNRFIVNKMSFPSKGQKDTIIYNSYIAISNIPAKAYEYIVNGKSAIEWVMERYAVTTHKESGIKNDPNDWAKEHNDPQYILNLLLSVITVSVKTVEIVEGLPRVEWE